jgi:hypothetical protein
MSGADNSYFCRGVMAKWNKLSERVRKSGPKPSDPREVKEAYLFLASKVQRCTPQNSVRDNSVKTPRHASSSSSSSFPDRSSSSGASAGGSTSAKRTASGFFHQVCLFAFFFVSLFFLPHYFPLFSLFLPSFCFVTLFLPSFCFAGFARMQSTGQRRRHLRQRNSGVFGAGEEGQNQSRGLHSERRRCVVKAFF